MFSLNHMEIRILERQFDLTFFHLIHYMPVLQSHFSPQQYFPLTWIGEKMAIQQIFPPEKWLYSHFSPLGKQGVKWLYSSFSLQIMLRYQNEVITSKGCINVEKKHVTDYQGPATQWRTPYTDRSVRPFETHSCPLHNFITSHFSILQQMDETLHDC